MTTALLTSSSTALGAAVLKTLVLDERFSRISVLAAPNQTELGSFASNKVEVISGDVRQPAFGLGERELAELLRSVNVVFNCFECSELDAALPDAQSSNVEPVRTLVAALEAAPQTRLVHLSTTWVCGTKRGLFTEFDLDCGQGFYNSYEQTKYEAERLLRQSQVSKQTTIVRRSVALTTAGAVRLGGLGFDAWFELLRAAHRLLVAGDPRIRIDLVPIEYVSAAMVALSLHPAAAGRTTHLVAGWKKSWSLRAVADAVTEFARTPRIGFMPPLFLGGVRSLSRLSLGRIAALPPAFESLRPYLSQRAVFDDFLARELLDPLEITCPEPDQFIGHLCARSLPPSLIEETARTNPRVGSVVDAAVTPEERSV